MLAAFASIIDDTHDRRIPESRKSMLVAMSTFASQADAEARLAAINGMVSKFTGAIHASARSVTLTSANTSIPITFTNTTGASVRLLVQLESDKLDQPGGRERVALPPSPVNQTIPIKVRVKTSGHFVVTVAMRSIVGGLPIGEPARRHRELARVRVVGNVAHLRSAGVPGAVVGAPFPPPAATRSPVRPSRRW